MHDYIQGILDEASDMFTAETPTQAENHLFNVYNPSTLLNVDYSKTFYNRVIQLMYLSKKTRPNTQLTIAFISTRFNKKYLHDWKNLGKTIKYLQGYKELVLTLEDDSIYILKWYVNALFTVHSDMKSHT